MGKVYLILQLHSHSIKCQQRECWMLRDSASRNLPTEPLQKKQLWREWQQDADILLSSVSPEAYMVDLCELQKTGLGDLLAWFSYDRDSEGYLWGEGKLECACMNTLVEITDGWRNLGSTWYGDVSWKKNTPAYVHNYLIKYLWEGAYFLVGIFNCNYLGIIFGSIWIAWVEWIHKEICNLSLILLPLVTRVLSRISECSVEF